MRKWIPAVLLAAVLILSARWFSELPPTVTPQWGALIPWAPAGEPVSREFAAFGVPLIAAAAWLLLRGVASPAGERLGRRFFPRWLVSEKTGAQAVERFGPTFDAIVAAVVAGLLLLHVVVLGTVLGWPLWTARVFSALIGAGLVVIGNILPRTRPNWVAGLRTKATLADPDLWRRTHRWFGGLVMMTGSPCSSSACAPPHMPCSSGWSGCWCPPC